MSVNVALFVKLPRKKPPPHFNNIIAIVLFNKVLKREYTEGTSQLIICNLNANSFYQKKEYWIELIK